MDVNEKSVLLTGAGGGIGGALAAALDRRGARLLLVGRNAAKLEQLKAHLGHGHHQVLVADLSTAQGRESVARAAQAANIEVLINNAGVSEFAWLEQTSGEAAEQMLNINLLAPMLLCRALLPHLQQRPAALIVNVGSTYGSIGYPGYSVYCASKFGLRGFSEALRRELADTRVRVLYVAPRATVTDMNDARVRALNEALKSTSDAPATVAAAVLGAIADSRRQTRYIGWPERLFVRLNHLFPSLVDRALIGQLPVIRRFANVTTDPEGALS